MAGSPKPARASMSAVFTTARRRRRPPVADPPFGFQQLALGGDGGRGEVVFCQPHRIPVLPMIVKVLLDFVPKGGHVSEEDLHFATRAARV